LFQDKNQYYVILIPNLGTQNYSKALFQSWEALIRGAIIQHTHGAEMEPDITKEYQYKLRQFPIVDLPGVGKSRDH